MNEFKASSPAAVRRSQAPFVLLLGMGIVLAIALAWIGRGILLLVFAAVVFAVLLTVILDWIQATLKFKRGMAFAVLLLGTATVIALILWTSGLNIIRQFSDLQVELPKATHQLVERLAGYSWGRWMLTQWSGYAHFSGNVNTALTRIGDIVLSTVTLLAGLIIMGLLGFYLAAEPEVYFAGIIRATPRRYRPLLEACAAGAVINLRWWLLSQMLSMTAVGIIVTVGLWALGVPLAGTLGVIAALVTFIPNVGPFISVVPAFLLALAISPTKGLLTVLLFLLVYFLEGNIITPLLQRRIVRLPPALTMTVQLLLAVIAGPIGLALAAPLTAASLGVLHILLPPDDPAPSHPSPVAPVSVEERIS